MSTIVYKITRTDDLEYIGISRNFKTRLQQHQKSNRFKQGIKNIVILSECEDYEEAEKLEEHFITLFDTYRNGLNVTPTGKGKNKNVKFNTLGHIYSEESRQKMSESAKRRGPHSNRKCSEHTKKKLSEIKRGKANTKCQKITDKDIDMIVTNYNNLAVMYDLEFVKTLVKKTQRDSVTLDNMYQMIGTNGKQINPITIYSHYYSRVYNVTASCIRRYITGAKRRIQQTVESVGPQWVV